MLGSACRNMQWNWLNDLLVLFKFSTSVGDRKSDKSEWRKVCSKTVLHVRMWSREGVSSTGVWAYIWRGNLLRIPLSVLCLGFLAFSAFLVVSRVWFMGVNFLLQWEFKGTHWLITVGILVDFVAWVTMSMVVSSMKVELLSFLCEYFIFSAKQGMMSEWWR